MGKLVQVATESGLGGIPRRTLVERMATRKETLLAIMRHLGHPYVAAYENASLEVLEEQVLLVATLHTNTWPGSSKPHPVDVALMAVLEAGLDDSLVRSIFGGVEKEEDLKAPITAFLKAQGHKVHAEVEAGDSRADLVGYRHAFFERDIVAVELKNEVRECERLEAQVANYARRADRVRVVMTPECLARVTLAREELATPAAYYEYIQKHQAELWVYDAKAESCVQLSPGCLARFDKADYNAMWTCLETRPAAA